MKPIYQLDLPASLPHNVGVPDAAWAKNHRQNGQVSKRRWQWRHAIVAQEIQRGLCRWFHKSGLGTVQHMGLIAWRYSLDFCRCCNLFVWVSLFQWNKTNSNLIQHIIYYSLLSFFLVENISPMWPPYEDSHDAPLSTLPVPCIARKKKRDLAKEAGRLQLRETSPKCGTKEMIPGSLNSMKGWCRHSLWWLLCPTQSTG